MMPLYFSLSHISSGDIFFKVAINKFINVIVILLSSGDL